MASPEDDYTKARNYLQELFKSTDSHASSCLSVVDHKLKDSRDLQCHFFGCLGIQKRAEVLDNADDPIWKEAKRLETENTKLNLGGDNDKMQDFDMRYITALNLQAELKRIGVLRRTPALKGLVREVRESINLWRNENEDKIKEVKDRRIDSHSFRNSFPSGIQNRRPSQLRVISTPGTGNKHNTSIDESIPPELEKILPEFSKKLDDVIIQGRRSKECIPEPDDDSSEYDLKRDIKARLIKLQRPGDSTSDTGSFMANVMDPGWEDVDDEIFKGTFPDQRVSVYWLLNGKFKRNKKMNLTEKVYPSTLRYFHIPANNMSWVEEAIASYFDEPAPEPGNNFQPGQQTKLVLNDGCWRGQEHGGGPDSIVHTRNLRPICEKISTDLEDIYRNNENTQKSLVLFMPYLHWETDRRRCQATDLIEQLADEHDLDKRETAKMWKLKRRQDRKGLHDLAESSPGSAQLAYTEPNYYKSRGKDRDKILEALAEMLWDRITEDPKAPMPLGLPHTLWQKIRDEEYSNELLVALKTVIEDKYNALGIPPILLPLVQDSRGGKNKLREWRDTMWQIKAAGRGHPRPHALEDIFWEEMRRVRNRVDNDQKMRHQEPEINGPLKDIFQKPTKIFKGVTMDEYRNLKPKRRLAQVLVKASKLYEQMMTYPDQRILEEYLFKHPPLHPRRTLDQAYFWRLRNTRLRDRDQVVYRYTNAKFSHRYLPQPPTDPKNDRSVTRNQGHSGPSICTHGYEPGPEKEDWVWTRHGQYEREHGCDQCNEDIKKVPRAIMVDQIWLWVLDKDTILTCFPQRYGVFDKDPSGVHQSIRMRVKTRNNPDNHIRSIFDLGLIILDECFDTFFDRTKTADGRPQALDMFAESIGRVTNKQAIAFQHLWTLSENQTGDGENVDPALLRALLNVNLEAELQREIRDIIDELDIILHIVQQQQDMITRFVKFAEQIMELDISSLKEQQSSTPENVDNADSTTLEALMQQKSTFKIRADDILLEVEDRIKELKGLKSSAESTAQNVNDLLGLKQQQASIVQAYEAMKQGEETVRQGKAIMVFTVMTIIFLPLSFMSSLFGMNAVELTGTDPSPGVSSSNSSGAVPDEIVPFWPTTFKRQIVIMFTLSLGTVLVVIIPTFSPLFRAVIFSVVNRVLVKTITWTGMYRMWLNRGWKSKDTRDKARISMNKMKKKVEDEMHARRLKESEIWDGVRAPEQVPKGGGMSGRAAVSTVSTIRQGANVEGLGIEMV